jgi:O-antigen/teichoic acid export membrane protein
VFLRYVSIDRKTFSYYWGNILVVTTIGGIGMTLLLHVIGARILNPASAAIVLLAALANCLGSQVTTCAALVFQAAEQMRTTAILNLLTNFLRTLAAAMLLVFYHRIGAWEWAMTSMIVSLIGSAVAIGVILAHFGKPRFSLGLLHSRLVEGVEFAFASSTTSAYNDLDKAMLSHYSMNAANGIYTLAYRAIDIATMPVNSLAAAAMPTFFRSGVGGLAGGAEALAGRLLKRSVVIAAAASLSLLVLAPLVPLLAGQSFSETVVALRWLSVIPLFRCVHEISGSALTGAGLQRYRSANQVIAVVLNLLLNLWLIPVYNWRGAAWSSIATDGALGAMNWAMLKILTSQQRGEAACELLESSK